MTSTNAMRQGWCAVAAWAAVCCFAPCLVHAQSPRRDPQLDIQEMLIKNAITAVNHGNLTGNYTSSKIVEAVPIMGIEKGDHVPGVPFYSIATSIEYTQAVAQDVQGFLRANGQWTGPSQGVIYHADPDFHRPPYAVAGAGAGVRWGRGELSLFVTNLFNENKVIQRPNNAGEEIGITVRPRTYGLSGTYSFR